MHINNISISKKSSFCYFLPFYVTQPKVSDIVVKWNKRVKYGSKLKDIDDYVKRLIYRCLVTDFPVAK